jgi:hypothetical protein
VVSGTAHIIRAPGDRCLDGDAEKVEAADCRSRVLLLDDWSDEGSRLDRQRPTSSR